MLRHNFKSLMVKDHRLEMASLQRLIQEVTIYAKTCTIQGLTNNKTKKEFIQYKSIDSSSLVESKERNTHKHVWIDT